MCAFSYFCTKHYRIRQLKTIFRNIMFLFIAGLIVPACNISRHIAEDEYLLKKNKIEIQAEKHKIPRDEISELFEQKPNRSFLGLTKLPMWIYLSTDHPERTKMAAWFNRKLGEPPVIFEPRLAEGSKARINTYLHNIGYFDAKATYEKEFNRRKNKVNVIYKIKPDDPYIIDTITYTIPDKKIRYYVLKNREESLIDTGQAYNAYKLEDERDRITKMLKNNGFFYFNQEYIYYKVDTTLGEQSVAIDINVSNVAEPLKEGKKKFVDHKRYFIKDIYINTDYNPLKKRSRDLDTSLVRINKKDNGFVPYYFIYRNDLRIKPQPITQSIFIRPGRQFILDDVQQTYRRLNDIRLFNYANIQFDEVNAEITDSLQHENYLNCNILLSRAKLQSYTIEAEGTNTGGDLGVGLNFSYQNKNIFRGAEIFSVRLSGAMEVQRLNQANGQEDGFLFFNTMETGVETSLYFPRFLIPVSQTFFPKYFKPKTTITAGINYQRRPKYERYITRFTFGYDWNESRYKKHIFIPFDVSLVKVLPTPEFDSLLQSLQDERLRNQFTDHLILALKYSFIFNNQDLNMPRDFIYFRINAEIAGNSIYLINNLSNTPKNEGGNYTLFNIRYAQYLRTDFDFRYYFVLNQKSRVATRALFGIGIPYWNSETLPFEKGFYGGGANGMRGWQFRSLGPGTYSNPDVGFDRMGDIKIEANVEYRFPVYRFVKSAIFTDIGNLWLLSKDETFPGGKFEFDTFLRQLAIDAGLGLRLDFGFFVFRMDAAIPLRNPALPSGDRWTFDEMQFSQINYNFGIGYPF